MPKFSLKDFPLVVDPAAQFLEVKLRPALDARQSIWRQLYRLNPSFQESPFILTNHTVHLFGSAVRLAACEFVLCYDHTGCLHALWYQENSAWEQLELPEELTGNIPRNPSVRFIFADTTDRDRFMRLFGQMIEAVRALDRPSASDAHEAITILGRAPHPPRLVTVGALPSEQSQT